MTGSNHLFWCTQVARFIEVIRFSMKTDGHRLAWSVSIAYNVLMSITKLTIAIQILINAIFLYPLLASSDIGTFFMLIVALPWIVLTLYLLFGIYGNCRFVVLNLIAGPEKCNSCWSCFYSKMIAERMEGKSNPPFDMIGPVHQCSHCHGLGCTYGHLVPVAHHGGWPPIYDHPIMTQMPPDLPLPRVTGNAANHIE